MKAKLCARFALLATLATLTGARAQGQDKFVIGVSAGLTGYVATIDRAWTDAVRMAADIVSQQGGDPAVLFPASKALPVIRESIGDLLSNAQHRVKRVHRALRHHGDAGQTQPANKEQAQKGEPQSPGQPAGEE